MTVRFHPEFPNDIRKFEEGYKNISDGLAARFRNEVDQAIKAIEASPQGAGHFLQTGSGIVVVAFRRRNLRAFPFLCSMELQPIRCYSARSSPLARTPSHGSLDSDKILLLSLKCGGSIIIFAATSAAPLK